MGSGAAQQQRIAVGRGVDDPVHSDDAAGAGRVLDDHRLAQKFAHPHRENAAHDVERAARRKRHDHDDGPRGIGLRLRRDRPDRRRNNQHFDEIAPQHVRLQPREPASYGLSRHVGRPRQSDDSDVRYNARVSISFFAAQSIRAANRSVRLK